MGTAPEIAADRDAALAFDLKRLDPAFLADPYPLYRALRAHDPIHRMPDGSYFLSRYDDCAAVYRDPDTWSSDKTRDFRPNFGDSLLYEHHTTSLVFNDPPYHSRVRRLLAPAFAPRALAALQPRIEQLVDRPIDRALAQSARDGGIDLITDFAAAIPVQLIGDMLGVPPDERGPLREWSLAILGALEPVLTPEQFARGVDAVRATPRSPASPCRKAPTCISASGPPTATRRSFPIPTGSISHGGRTGISRSARAFMPAPACRSRAWRGRSRSDGWSHAARRSRRPARPCVAGGHDSAALSGAPRRTARLSPAPRSYRGAMPSRCSSASVGWPSGTMPNLTCCSRIMSRWAKSRRPAKSFTL